MYFLMIIRHDIEMKFFQCSGKIVQFCVIYNCAHSAVSFYFLYIYVENEIKALSTIILA